MTDPTTPHPRLAAALAAVQAELPDVRKGETATVPTKSGGSYKYSYADLADVSRAVLPLLGRNGLAFTCKPTITEAGKFVLAYSLMHASGEREDGEYPLPSGTAQEIGSAITYGRRYVLCAITGVAPDADDDGTAASSVRVSAPADERGRRDSRAARPQAEEGWDDAEPVVAMTPARQKALHAKLRDADLTDRDKGLAFLTEVTGRDITSSKDLTVDEFATVMRRLDGYIRQSTPPAEGEAEA